MIGVNLRPTRLTQTASPSKILIENCTDIANELYLRVTVAHAASFSWHQPRVVLNEKVAEETLEKFES